MVSLSSPPLTDHSHQPILLRAVPYHSSLPLFLVYSTCAQRIVLLCSVSVQALALFLLTCDYDLRLRLRPRQTLDPRTRDPRDLRPATCCGSISLRAPCSMLCFLFPSPFQFGPSLCTCPINPTQHSSLSQETVPLLVFGQPVNRSRYRNHNRYLPLPTASTAIHHHYRYLLSMWFALALLQQGTHH